MATIRRRQKPPTRRPLLRDPVPDSFLLVQFSVQFSVRMLNFSLGTEDCPAREAHYEGRRKDYCYSERRAQSRAYRHQPVFSSFRDVRELGLSADGQANPQG